MGWFNAIFFGFGIVVGLVRLFDSGVQVRITSSGIYYKPWSNNEIPWGEITRAWIWSYRQARSIIFALRDPQRFPPQRLLGLFAGLNKSLTGGDIPISLTGTDGDFDKALAAIERFGKIRVEGA